MALGRLQAALGAATNEVTVAAAKLNFDFTLVKFEAPKEYQGLGSVLSAKRKDNAEFGSSHILARRLGALFEGVCPPTPRLLEAYGNRASEIAKASKTASGPYVDTVFGEYIGVDGTSIWAAATSSKSALHVHLLASLLARMWTAQEAIAIWVELVSERKKDIARKVDKGEPVEFSLAAAVGQDITRPQLAEWDSSARAWLRTADDVFCLKQKQLELIIKNIELPVSGDLKVFPSVIKTWTVAVETMDKLITGMPLAVQNGATLLGLSAWHLYPDISVFSPQLSQVQMDDPLVVKGGVLSLGLSAAPQTSRESHGVYWSLSLAQLRHYGRPVKVERALETDARITFPQLTLVIFAALLAAWKINDSEGDSAAKAIIALVDHVNSIPQSTADRRLLQFLKDGASAYINRATADQDLQRKLKALGRRRARSFFGGDDRSYGQNNLDFFFNLTTQWRFMQSFRDEECRIKYLRHVAARLTQDQTPLDAFLIRYAEPISLSPPKDLSKNEPSGEHCSTQTSESLKRSTGSKAEVTIPGDSDRIYPSVEESPQDLDEISDNSKEDADNSDTGMKGPNNGEVDDEENSRSMIADDEDDDHSHRSHDHHDQNDQWYRPARFSQSSNFAFATALSSHCHKQTHAPSYHRWVNRDPQNYVRSFTDSWTMNARTTFRSSDDFVQIVEAADPDAFTYDFLLGDPDQAALFLRRVPGVRHNLDSSVIIEDIHWCIKEDLLSPTTLLQILSHTNHSRGTVEESLRVLAYAAIIYDNLPDATIDTGILGRALLERRWAKCMFRSKKRCEWPDTLHFAFAVIAYFESGIHDVEPSQLVNVVAVSSTNSLFVASSVRLPFLKYNIFTKITS
jgi:hypothetical protein